MNISIRITLAIEIFINVITNGMLNALCAWLLNINTVAVGTGAVGVFIDVCITCFFICLFTTPFAVMAAKRYQKTGILNAWKPRLKLLSFYSKRTVLLALTFAVSIMLPVGIILCIGFSLLGIAELSVISFTLYKGVLGGIIGGLVCALTLARFQIS